MGSPALASRLQSDPANLQTYSVLHSAAQLQTYCQYQTYSVQCGQLIANIFILQSVDSVVNILSTYSEKCGLCISTYRHSSSYCHHDATLCEGYSGAGVGVGVPGLEHAGDPRGG